jgi:hypothetical protein
VKKIFLVIASTLFLFSCEKVEDYPEIPEIKFRSFEVIPGDGEYIIAEGVLTFDFVDGDGNLGFAENFDDDTTNNIIDFIYTEYYKKDGVFVEKKGSPFYLPYFQEGVYRKNLKGKIDIYLPHTILSPDTVYYAFYIIDRDANKSNMETTSEIVYSELLEQYKK